MIGRTIGKYRIVGQLGRGGMGTVFKAVDETLDREVAIKVLNPELADSDIMKRFRAEATTLAKLNHPEIATIYELFRSETDLLMVMEFVRGETLDKLSDRLGAFPPDRAAYIIDKVLSALEHAHRAGIVHRDMKPANVMITDIGGVKIMDFGIARVRGAEHMTIEGYMMGTPAYMPPEQVLGHEVDGRADLYSVGVVFYRLLAGTLPFKADTAIGMVQKQISDPPTPLHAHRADLPPWCEPILQRALAKSPIDRFQTAEEFRWTLAKATGMVNSQLTGAFTSGEAPDAPEAPAPTIAAGDSTPVRRGAAASEEASTQVVSPAPRQPESAPAFKDATTIVLRRQHFAVAASLLAILAAGVAVLAYAALRPRSAPPSATAPAATTAAAANTRPASPALSPAPAPAAASPGPVSEPSKTASSVRGGSATTGSSPAAPPAVTAPTAPVTAGTPAVANASSSATGKAPANPRGPSAPATTDAPAEVVPPSRVFQPMVFGARAFVLDDDGKSKELDAQVVLSDGRITVTEGDQHRPIHDVKYESVMSISYSRGRDPLWNSPQGPAPVARAGGGALGLFRGERHWLALRTHDRFLVIRLGGGPEAQRAIGALQERTGRTAELVAERKDAK